MGSFTPLVFGTNGGMGADCNCFLKRLAEKLSEKNEEPYHITITWIRTLLSFEILRADVCKYQPEVCNSEKFKILKKIHNIAHGKLLQEIHVLLRSDYYF